MINKILLLGFKTEQEIDEAIHDFINLNDCWIFSVLCGGQTQNCPETPASAWAKKNGAPLIYIREENIDKLFWKMSKEADYLIAKVDDDTPQIVKNFIMKFKDTGKHGTIIR